MDNKEFSCLLCGWRFSANPPDDLHPSASLDKTMLRNPLEMKIECKNCGNKISLYWGRQPVGISLI